MMNSKNFLILTIACFISNLTFAQPVDAITHKANKPVKTADKIYENLGYKASLAHFEAEADLSKDDLVKIANSYRLNHDTENAELWYGQVIQENDQPIFKLYYAQALHSNRKYEEAKKYYLEYDKSIANTSGKDKRGYLSAQAVSRINEFNHSAVQIKNESLINSNKLDFSPTYYQDGIVFVSTQKAASNKARGKDFWIDDNFMSLFFAKKSAENADLIEVKEFSHSINTKFHEGPVTFSRDGNRIFFTRNNYNKGKRRNDANGIMKLKIYTSVNNHGEWSTAEELPFSTDEYEECHPTLSADGRTLYFSSDRSGGVGGMDLYKSEFRSGKWSTPVNLGESINTPGNEVFPFIHDDGTLYFASNGWGGLGGLDIFKAQEYNDNHWAAVENIGTPFNSNKDDFGYILNVTGTEGYLTSARAEGMGKDDIYSFIIPPNARANKAMAKICAYEALNQDHRLSDVKVVVTEKIGDVSNMENKDSEFVLSISPTVVENEYDFKLKMKADKISNQLSKPKNYVTDDHGLFMMNVQPNRTYHMVAKKDGYVIAEENFTTGHQLDQNALEICIPIPLENNSTMPVDHGNCLVLEGSVVNKKYGNTISAATVTMINLCSGEELVVTSDKEGKFNFPCIPCGCEFALKGAKKNFLEGLDQVSSLNMPCDKSGIVSAKVPLMPNIPGVAMSTPSEPVKREPTKYTAPKEEGLNVGSIIELENIYYDFDQFYIRDDAKPDLEKIVQLMTRYADMEIELGSHTDSRGKTSYNATLSQNRANAARKYLIERGIDSRRITAFGYGETQLRNRCVNFADCSEADHQYNRRTEVKVTKFNKSEVEVRYNDSGPKKIDAADPKRKFRWN